MGRRRARAFQALRRPGCCRGAIQRCGVIPRDNGPGARPADAVMFVRRSRLSFETRLELILTAIVAARRLDEVGRRRSSRADAISR